MKNYLLLGAGFSRNWGGWLGTEVFDYLLGSPEIDDGLRAQLWQERKGGFEAVLAGLQEDHIRSRRQKPDERLAKFQVALNDMFVQLNAAYEQTPFEFGSSRGYRVGEFLSQFDSIFTLNQDLLLERHYLNDNVSLNNPNRWTGWEIPGMTPRDRNFALAGRENMGVWVPRDQPTTTSKRLQPIIKLHGSCNWADERLGELMVMGGNKASLINQIPILNWNSKYFSDRLSESDSRLMVIGYSFGDDHINGQILNAAATGNLKVFIIDPDGVDVLDKNRGAMIHSPGDLAKKLWPHVIGASRRSLKEIFGSDRAEHAKVLRFFS